MKTEPEDIVKAFDECREFVFGISMGRDNPHKDDLATAQLWLDAGATFVVCVMVFAEQMNWMHEKHLKYGGHVNTPKSLKVFDENIEAAMRRSKNGGKTDFWENQIAQWRARCKAWKKSPASWVTNNWGNPPFEENCRVPKSVLAELD